MELNKAQMLVEVESAKCECCRLEEECTGEYIARVKADFGGRWLCGLCAEAVRDEAGKGKGKGKGSGRTKEGLEEAVKAHMSFCRRTLQSNPATHVVNGMRQMLRRRSVCMPSVATPPSSSKKRSGKAAGLASSVDGHR